MEALNLTYTQGGILFSVSILALALSAVPGGILADVVGVRKTVGIGAIIIGVSGFLRGFSPDFLTLLILNFLLGIGCGLEVPNLPKLVSNWFPRKHVGTATGIYSTGAPLGSSIGLALTIPLILPLAGNWQGVFHIWGVMALIAAGVWWAIVRVPPSTVPNLGSQSRRSLEGSFKDVWKNKYVWIVATIFFLGNVCYFTTVGLFPSFFIHQGATEADAAYITAVGSILNIPIILLISFVSDKIGLRKPFMWICYFAAVMGFFSLIYTPLSFAWILMAVLGLTLPCSFVMSLILPVDLVKPKYVGTASGIVLSVGFLGGFVGPLLAGYLRDLTGTFTYSLILLGISMMISVGLVFTIPETGSRGKYQPS